MKQHLVVLTGAGMSAESGLRTFRDSNGLWEEYSIYEVATPEAWEKNPKLVIDFYNQRRKQLYEVLPNQAHLALKELEEYFNLSIITQNIDDLHEQAGSSHVLHLHGELKKVRSSLDENNVLNLEGWELKWGDLCPKGSQLRPHVVWFGEAVPEMENAISIIRQADILLIIGTSLNVYPAASLVQYVKANVPVYLIDPQPVQVSSRVIQITEKASVGMLKMKDLLLRLYNE